MSRVTEATLSLLRTGALNSPSFATVVSLAEVFGIAAEFFTLEYHRQRRQVPMRSRVWEARLDRNSLTILAAAINDLPLQDRSTVLSLIELLEASSP